MMSIYEKLTQLQNELKAPKGQRNSFGNYNYRSAEDILEAVKPLLGKYNLTQIISDDIELIGDRYYIKATVTLVNNENAEEKISVTALARESQVKKGMDESQITGTASSYARKYALNGLYAIDDTKDSDTDAYKKQSMSQKDIKLHELVTLVQKQGIKNKEVSDMIWVNFDKKSTDEMTITELDELMELVKNMGKL